MNIQKLKSLHGYHYKNLNIIDIGYIRSIEYIEDDPLGDNYRKNTHMTYAARNQHFGPFYLIELDNGMLLRLTASYLVRGSKREPKVGKSIYQINTRSGEHFYTMNLKWKKVKAKAMNYASVLGDPFNVKHYASNYDAILARRQNRTTKSK